LQLVRNVPDRDDQVALLDTITFTLFGRSNISGFDQSMNAFGAGVSPRDENAMLNLVLLNLNLVRQIEDSVLLFKLFKNYTFFLFVFCNCVSLFAMVPTVQVSTKKPKYSSTFNHYQLIVFRKQVRRVSENRRLKRSWVRIVSCH
jgi:hypothetical protein